MSLKKILYCLASVCTFAVCVITAGTTAASAEDIKNGGTFEDSGISYVSANNEAYEKLSVYAEKGAVLAGIAKINKKKEITVSSWNTYDDLEDSYGDAEIPLSTLNNAKDNYIAVKTYAKGDVISLIKIPAADKVIKAVFDPVSGVMKAGSGDTANAVALKEIKTDGSGFQVRTKDGMWSSTEEDVEEQLLDFINYQQEGATFYVRKGAVYVYDSVENAKMDQTETYTYGTQKQVVHPYVLPPLQSKEVKVKIPALPKGPAVYTDYMKGTVTFPKNSQYRVWEKSTLLGKDSKANTEGMIELQEKTTLTVNDILDKVNADEQSDTNFVLEVRFKATNRKPASKWTQISLKRPAALPDIVKGTETIELAAVREEQTPVITFEYAKKKNKNVILVKNSSKEFDYEVTTASVSTAPEPNLTPKKIAKGKTVVLSGIADGASIFVRKSGDRKQSRWVGEFTYLGIVKYQ